MATYGAARLYLSGEDVQWMGLMQQYFGRSSGRFVFSNFSDENQMLDPTTFSKLVKQEFKKGMDGDKLNHVSDICRLFCKKGQDKNNSLEISDLLYHHPQTGIKAYVKRQSEENRLSIISNIDMFDDGPLGYEWCNSDSD